MKVKLACGSSRSSWLGRARATREAAGSSPLQRHDYTAPISTAYSSIPSETETDTTAIMSDDEDRVTMPFKFVTGESTARVTPTASRGRSNANCVQRVRISHLQYAHAELHNLEHMARTCKERTILTADTHRLRRTLSQSEPDQALLAELRRLL